jgi:uncharacterized protein (DUF488 family)
VKLPFFTIGHSTRTLEEFVELLAEAEIGLLADIRKFTRSRTNPQFNEDHLASALARHDISYEHVVALGGRRGKAPDVPPDENALWKNQSFHNYADYAATSPQFREALDYLRAEGRKRRCAVMCSEAVWWRCHRRIVADYLIAYGETVFHIMGEGRLEPAHLTPGAIIEPGGKVIYPRLPES